MDDRLISFLVFILLVTLAAVFSGQFIGGEWYAAMSKPAWILPAWGQAVVAPIASFVMACAAWLAWCSDRPGREAGLACWFATLVLGVAWPWLFFGLHRPGWALGGMSLLILAAALTGMKFRPVNHLAAKLMVPYLAWLGFMWVLNLALWRLNGGGFSSIFG